MLLLLLLLLHCEPSYSSLVIVHPVVKEQGRTGQDNKTTRCKHLPQHHYACCNMLSNVQEPCMSSAALQSYTATPKFAATAAYISASCLAGML
jgi:hypothetical protein